MSDSNKEDVSDRNRYVDIGCGKVRSCWASQFFKFIITLFCMLSGTTYPDSRENMAINCLLQEDQNEFHQFKDWEEVPVKKETSRKTPTPTLVIPLARSSLHCTRNSKNRQYRNRYNPENFDSNHLESCWTPNKSEKRVKEEQFQNEKEGEYWCSKVNWTSCGLKQQRFSQPKLPKQSYESSSLPAKRSNSRNGIGQKRKDEEYKTNLIYCILRAEAQLLKKQESRIKSNYQSSSAQLSSPVKLKKAKEDYSMHLSKYMQQSMRDTLRKMWMKREDGKQINFAETNKRSDFSRSSFVRQLLMNFQKNRQQTAAEEKPPSLHMASSQPAIDEKERKVKPLSSQELNKAEREVESVSKVLNLNMEAQRVYNSRSVNRRGARFTHSRQLP